jgi:hypothetical protein
VLAAVADADRWRRRRAASRRLWTAAPFVAAAVLCLAAISRLAGSTAVVPLIILAAAVFLLTASSIFARRERPVSDAIAADIDAHAGLGGELRSAGWFASRSARDAWAELHVRRAAERLGGIDWAALYPPVRAPRARAATAVMVCATLAVAVAFPGRVVDGSVRTTRAGGDVRLPPDSDHLLSPELQQQLEALLAAAEAGTLPADGRSGTAAEMRDLLERLGQLRDRQTLEALARAMDTESDSDAVQNLKRLAERLGHAAEKSAATREFQKALEKLAMNLSDAAKATEAEGEREKAMASSEGGKSDAAAEASAAKGMDESAIQALSEAQGAAGGAGVIMMSEQQAESGAASPGLGLGGGSGAMASASESTAIETALKGSIVEANRDSAGANVEAEMNRKTEQGQATAAFTRSASGKSDRSSAFAPPPVPESRRGDVQRYFLRQQ